MKLDTLRMDHTDACNIKFRKEDWQVNYLYGLDDLCKKYLRPNFTVLELGSHDGVSTELFASYADKVTAVDLVKRERIMDVLKRNQNINFHQKSFFSWRDSNTERFDLVYIDGHHTTSSVRADLEIAEQVVKPEGFISGHDYNQRPVRIAVDMHFRDRLDELELFKDSSWLIKTKL